MSAAFARIMAVALLALGVSVGAIAGNEPPTVTASHAWIRVLPGTLPAGGYVTLVNTGDKPLALTGATSTVYASVMLHQSTTQDGMSRMHMVKQLTLPPHGTVKLAPGGYHLMLMQARHTVKPGDVVPITLDFANGSTLEVAFTARPANAH